MFILFIINYFMEAHTKHYTSKNLRWQEQGVKNIAMAYSNLKEGYTRWKDHFSF